MRYLDVVYRTGGKPKSPPPPPDPAIAAERARREAVQIGLADARRTARFGSNSTILTQGTRPGTAMTRPTEKIGAQDPATTPAGQKTAEIGRLQQQLANTKVTSGIRQPGGRKNGERERLQSQIESLQSQITPADTASFNAAQKDQNIAAYINRNRTRLGVQSSRSS